MGNIVRYLGLTFTILANIGMLFINAYPRWKQNSVIDTNSILRSVRKFEGLWTKCTFSAEEDKQTCVFDETAFFNLPRKRLI